MGYLDKYKDPEKRKAYNREYFRVYMRKYNARLRAEGKRPHPCRKEYFLKLRSEAINKLGGFVCAECGCDEKSILEINHIKGGGCRQRRETKNAHKKVLHDIINERTETGEYNVLCRVCNAKHYVSDILGFTGHKIIWNSDR